MSAEKPQKGKTLKTASKAAEGMPQGTETASEIPTYVSEDIYRFWKENGTRIIIYSILLLLAIFGTQSWKYFSTRHEVNLREEFAQLSTPEEKEAFASKHKSHGLAGYAFMQLAKTNFDAKNYEAALKFYTEAEGSLKGGEFEGFVLLGKATCLMELDRTPEATEVLNEVADNTLLADGIRAEAMFKLIIIAENANQDDRVGEMTEKLEAIDETGIWTERLKSIKYYQ